MGTSVTRHVVSVPTSPGTSRRAVLRASHQTRSRSNSVCGPATTIHYLPFSRAIHPLPRAQGPTALVRHHPTLNRTHRQYAGNFTEPLAHPRSHRSWHRAPLISAGSTRSDCTLVNIRTMPRRNTCNWIPLSTGFAACICNIHRCIHTTIAIDAVPIRRLIAREQKIRKRRIKRKWKIIFYNRNIYTRNVFFLSSSKSLEFILLYCWMKN